MAYTSVISNPNEYVISDLNARLEEVSPQDSTVIADREAVLQSIYRLFNTEEGEIPNYRSYGMNLKQFVQRPLDNNLANDINNYVKGKITTYVDKVSIVNGGATVNYNTSSVYLNYTLLIKATQEIIEVPPLSVYVG